MLRLKTAGVLCLFAVGACGGAGGDGPAPICRTPVAPTGPLFTEVTSEYGLAKTATFEPLATGIVAADLDGDGWQDFFASVFPAAREPAGSKRTRFLFMSRPDPSDPKKRIFVDELDASGLLATRDGVGGRGLSAIAFADLDNDGDMDAIGCPGEIATTILDSCATFLNDGTGHFTLPAVKGDLETDLFVSGTSAVFDYDRDGVLDYWPATIGRWQYFTQTTGVPLSRMRLYQGAGDGSFNDRSAAAGLPPDLSDGFDYRMIFGVTACDVDLDGDRDILLGEYGVGLGPNHLYRNDGAQGFVDVGFDLGIAFGPKGQGGFTYLIACGDLEDDGDVDLFTSELQHAWYPDTDHSEPLINNTPPGQPLQPFTRPGRATLGLDRPHTGSRWTEGDNQVFMVDYDHDGRKDVVIASANYPQQSAADPDWTHTWVYRQKAEGGFEDVTMQTPFWDKTLQSLGNGAWIDLDNDGDLDYVTGTGTFNGTYLMLTSAVHAFRNDVGQLSNSARLRFVGKGAGFSNRAGLGARVEVTAGGRTQYLEFQAGETLDVGLGDACEIDKLVVRWPDAASTTSTYLKLQANYEIVISEGAAKVEYRGYGR